MRIISRGTKPLFHGSDLKEAFSTRLASSLFPSIPILPFSMLSRIITWDRITVRPKSGPDHIIQTYPDLVKNFPNLHQFCIIQVQQQRVDKRGKDFS